MEYLTKSQRVELSRRAFLIGGASLAGAWRAMPSTPACVLTTEQEEGPYYVDYENVRRDITEGKQGVPLGVKIALAHAKQCTPLSNAVLDIWHCDAVGIYSGFTANHPGGPGGSGDRPPSTPPEGRRPPSRGPRVVDETRFLRG